MTSKNLTVTAAAVVVLSGAAFMAGRISASGKKDTVEEEAQGPAGARSARATGSAADGVTAREAAQKAARERAKREPVLAAMQRINLMNDPIERAQAWLDYVNSLDPAQYEAAVAAFRDEGFTREHMGEYEILLSAWARRDPISALDYAQANTGNPFARNTILATWASSDPDAAIAWAEQHFEGKGANPWMVGVIKGLAASDPSRASTLMTAMPMSQERGEALGSLVPYMMQQGGDAARAWAESITDDHLRNGAMAQVADRLAKLDPASTAAWLSSTKGDAAVQAMDNVLSTWAEKDKSAATAYYENMPTGDARSSALRGITDTMAQSDPKAAAAFLDQHSADATDRTYQQFVWNSFGSAPEIAVQYIAKIDDEGNRNGTYDRLLGGWLRNDPEAASAYINSASSPIPANVRDRLQQRMQNGQRRQ